MKSIKHYAMFLFLPVFVLTSGYVKNMNISHPLHGTVYNKDTGKPLPGIYLYTIQGEEEGVTNKDGEFRFTTWQKLPVVIYLRNGRNEDIPVRITDPSKKIFIRL